ncbi:hypothetical protein, partial [Mycolicibacterium hippocampi]|uniref:hypothetical protein n=1 Tax=Mycolicibacterium hippocampi TaxID=659824 RepID=UPI0021F313A7
MQTSAIITDEKHIYPDTGGATADLGHSPDATVHTGQVKAVARSSAVRAISGSSVGPFGLYLVDSTDNT